MEWGRLWGLLLITLLALLAPSAGHAMDVAGIGPRIGAVDPDGLDNTFSAGAHLDLQDAGSRVHLIPYFMIWEEGGLTDVNPNVDMMYHFNPDGAVSPYLGAGVGLHFYSADGPGPDPDTDPSANFFGGLLVPTRSMSVFFEGRATVADRDQFGLLTGVTFPLAR
jgi:hypothetical protein